MEPTIPIHRHVCLSMRFIFTLYTTVSGFIPGPMQTPNTPIIGTVNIEPPAPGTIHHKDQTNLEYNAFVKSRFNIPANRITSSMKNAREQIAAANARVDDVSGPNNPYPEKNDGAAHFDNEWFQESHPEYGLDDNFILFKTSTPIPTGLNKATKLPARELGAPTQFPSVFSQYQRNNACFDSCFKGDQTNWELWKSWECVQEERVRTNLSECMVKDCSSNIVAGGLLTSGYYKTSTTPGRPSNKCAHGGLNDRGATGTEGINKDSTWNLYAPHHYLHTKAAKVSQKATQEYFVQLETAFSTLNIGSVSYSQPKLTERQLKLLLGIGSSDLVFIIDTTASMTDVIESAKKTAIDIVSAFKVSPDREPTSYILMGYNDPAGDTPSPAADADLFISQISRISASGGGDCLEPSIEVLSKTLDVIADDAHIFLFTDAGPKDPSRSSEVLDKVNKKNVKISVFLYPSRCSDRSTYDSISGASGGQVVGVSNAADTATMVKFALKQINPLYVSLYSDTPITAATPPIFRRAVSTTDIAVEKGMESITFSTSGSSKLTITRPDGTTVSSGDPSVDITLLTSFNTVTVDHPASGIWHVSRSDANSALSVFGSSYLTFIYFRFVEIRGGHPAWFQVFGDPVVSQTYTVNAELEGDYKTAHFELRSTTSGKTLEKLELERYESPDEFPRYLWWGNATVPCGSFYAYVVGEDNSGHQFQRVYTSVFGSQSPCNGTSNYTATLISGSSTVLGSSGSRTATTSKSIFISSTTFQECGQTGTAVRHNSTSMEATGEHVSAKGTSTANPTGAKFTNPACVSGNCTIATGSPVKPAQFTGNGQTLISKIDSKVLVATAGLLFAYIVSS
ncbi:hypothetical protein BCR34DRAFT_600859 [Clohesyomyces aquaticus]|uniref:VWFA domain-containing protein n=1 Tax=Clohesyomyces aquaticus TaxID=1231657 RepID=A0A1Y1ZQM2_9PLEO|nr:hypothetical protein BCR34DRAFT_600859 [Clohesyomyces aquaticus]